MAGFFVFAAREYIRRMAESVDWTARIRSELEEAARLDLEARAHRRRAGEYLALAREDRRFDLIVRGLGITLRSAVLLVAMAESTEPPAVLPRRARQ